MKGDSATNGTAIYGVQGIADSNNTPGPLYESAQWTDKHGNFWLFGGMKNYGVTYNTLWKFNSSTNEWTWIKGDTTWGSSGVYGTQGIPAATNNPGARAWGSWSWVDTSGNFWLYGGYGYNAIGIMEGMSDLWKYDISTNEWTWMDGLNMGVVNPVYGTKGTPSDTASPGSRMEGDAAWVDDINRLWLFSGQLLNGPNGFGNDMWMWDQNINEWTWMQGTNTVNSTGSYGIKGVADSSNHPSGRGAYCNWKDSDGNFYFFGGSSTFTHECWNDLWKYDWHTNVFTWISGLSSSGDNGTYGTQSVPDTNNIPAARQENRCFWQDHCGNFWMWGGRQFGYGNPTYNDLWMYRPSTREWTWPNGEMTANYTGNYGVKGVSSATNEPAAKCGAIGWIDSIGHLWMFGGVTASAWKNDLWCFVPDSSACIQQQPSPINFATMDASICEKFCTNFTDQSTNNPTSWQWIFPGGDPASSTSQNPTNICYDSPGTYDVTLITTNANGSDTLTLQNYITVYPTPPFPNITQVGYTLTSSAASSYQWQLNSTDIPGATNQSYTILQTGYYTVIVGDSNSCKNSTTVYVLISGVDEVNNDVNLSICPNPSSGNFIVEWLNGFMAGEVSIDVVNTLGQKVFSFSEKISSSHFKKEMDLTDAACGVYFIEIKTENEFVMKKILIAH